MTVYEAVSLIVAFGIFTITLLAYIESRIKRK